MDEPLGYIYDPEAIASALDSGLFAASAGVSEISGAAKSSGLSYFNLTAFCADFLRSNPEVAGGRRTIDLGADGVILEPLGQQTGICNGCSHGEAAFQSWCHRYVTTGGPVPQRVSFAWAYLAGRDSMYVKRGDSGAIPSLTIRAYHDYGVLPVGLTEFKDLLPHGPNSEESLCIRFRDNPKAFIDQYRMRAQPFKTRVYAPNGAWDVADCVHTGRAVTFGTGVQGREARPGTNGVSSLYSLNGGHETFCSGWALVNGRLVFLKTESWYNANHYPGSQYPNNRVVLQTDDGPKLLYPGQCAVWADEWLSNRVECWAVGAPTEGIA